MVSILLAIRNGELFLSESIQSILNQTYTNFELLIGFNGTLDNSKRIVSNFNDKRIKIYDYGMDSGKSKTLNKLVQESKGDWLAIQDDDDIWLPHKLELQVAVRNTNNYDVIGTKCFYIDEFDKIIGAPYLMRNNKTIYLLTRNGYNQVVNASVIFRKDLVFNVQGWNEDIKVASDMDFWLKLMNVGFIFINLDQKLVLHRLHKNSYFNTQEFKMQDIIYQYALKNVDNLWLNKVIIKLYLFRSFIYRKFYNFQIIKPTQKYKKSQLR